MSHAITLGDLVMVAGIVAGALAVFVTLLLIGVNNGWFDR